MRKKIKFAHLWYTPLEPYKTVVSHLNLSIVFKREWKRVGLIFTTTSNFSNCGKPRARAVVERDAKRKPAV